jgi:DNA-binding beta-propeller fold protein YncE
MKTYAKILTALAVSALLTACPGSSGDSSSTTTTTTTIYGLAYDAVNARLYISNVGRSTVQSLDPSALANTPSTLAGGDNVTGLTNGDGSAARFYSPASLVMGGTTLYVADTLNNVLRAVTSLTPTTGLKTVASYVGGFTSPNDITADNTNSIIYVADTGNNSIKKVTMGINPAVSLLAGSADGTSGFKDDTGNAAKFYEPTGVAVDPVSQTVYVSDSSNHLIRQITSAGVVTTLAGVATTPASSGYVNATAGAGTTTAKFNFPTTLVLSGGALYVTDTGNHAIRKIDTTTGEVTTFAGANIASTSGLTDATGTNARFSLPRGIALNGQILYVGDQSGTKLRRISLAPATLGLVETFTTTF